MERLISTWYVAKLFSLMVLSHSAAVQNPEILYIFRILWDSCGDYWPRDRLLPPLVSLVIGVFSMKPYGSWRMRWRDCSPDDWAWACSKHIGEEEDTPKLQCRFPLFLIICILSQSFRSKRVRTSNLLVEFSVLKFCCLDWIVALSVLLMSWLRSLVNSLAAAYILYHPFLHSKSLVNNGHWPQQSLFWLLFQMMFTCCSFLYKLY
jgi:hypothetical protein